MAFVFTLVCARLLVCVNARINYRRFDALVLFECMSPLDGPPRYIDPSSGIFRILTLVHLEGVNDRWLRARLRFHISIFLDPHVSSPRRCVRSWAAYILDALFV